MENKFGLIIGFIFGLIVAPFLATLGLVSNVLELLRHILAPGISIINLIIPNVQVSQDTFYAPWYKWVLSLILNGIIFAVIGYLLQIWLKKRKLVFWIFVGITILLILIVVIEALVFGVTA